MVGSKPERFGLKNYFFFLTEFDHPKLKDKNFRVADCKNYKLRWGQVFNKAPKNYLQEHNFQEN